MHLADPPIDIHPEVAEALHEGAAVVALESTIISHGLPRENNRQIAREIEVAVRSAGAVPATLAILDSRVRIGLDGQALDQVASREDVVKASIRDVPVALARGVPAATTVASTAWLASLAGISVFATGGLGGVHRGAGSTWDESADLAGLAGTPITVVCAGVKSILDVPATLERLESLSVTVVGYRTDVFPGFYVRETQLPVPWRVEDPGEVARIHDANVALGNRRAVVVVSPIAADRQMDPALHDRVLTAGLREMEERGVRGKDVTPFLLAYFHEHTGGASLRANVDLVLANAHLAGQIAAAGARSRTTTDS